MSRRFIVLLERVSRIRDLIEREQRSATPSPTRLMRMKRIYLELSRNLRSLTEKRLISIASAPRLRPELIFRSVGSTPAFSRGW